MSIALNPDSEVGVALANRLGLQTDKPEGHDLAGPCIACKSSDAFRLHQHTGVAQCYSCGGKWSPLQVAEAVLGDRGQAKSVMVELGIFEPSASNNGDVAKPTSAPQDPTETIARQKGVPPESLRAYGAKVISPYTVRLPAYGPDGSACTTMSMSVRGGKGTFAKGKPAGLFFPQEDGKVRLPRADETWHVVEGPKDAAALHGLGLLACGLNTCRLAAKFGRLFKDVDVILIPDRDRAGEEGAGHSARVLRNVALSTRIAVLPAEFKESKGDDVRDVLRRPDGRELVLQAIADANPSEAGGESSEGEDGDVSAEVQMPEGDPLTLTVSPTFGKPQRRVIAKRGEISHRDRINTDSDIARGRFIKKLAAKLEVDVDVLRPLVDPQLTALADQTDEQATAGPGDEKKGQATLVAEMAAKWEVWHTPSTDAFATIPVGDHDENWPVRSQTFKRFVSKEFYEEQQKALGNDALSAGINLIEARGLFGGQEHEAHVRVAEHKGNLYIDLGNDAWEVVEITANGWQVVAESPVKFRRSRSMLPLPKPECGGHVDELRGFLNVDDSTWTLVVAWLVTALRPNVRFPVLALFAEQGSGKSTTGRLLRELVDPNAAPLRAEPRDARDLMIAANNSWCLAFDNLSYVPSWLSDALCRLSTGGGFATRELYTDQDEVIFDAMRPILLTSIEEVATRSDLLDRCVIVWLPAIPEDRRRPEAELIEAFREVRPRIFGALLDAVAGALRDLPETEVSGLPRMADFALWATAAESALGWSKGTFMAAYNSNRASANHLSLE